MSMTAFCGTATGGGTMTGAGGSEGCLLNACGLGGGSSLAFGQQGEQELVTARQRAETHSVRASHGAQAGLR